MVAPKLVHLIAVRIPPWSPLARKNVEVRPAAIRLDATVELVRLAAVFTSRSEDQLADIFALAPAIAAASEQHEFGLRSRREAQADVKVALHERRDPVPSALGLQPGEAAR